MGPEFFFFFKFLKNEFSIVKPLYVPHNLMSLNTTTLFWGTQKTFLTLWGSINWKFLSKMGIFWRFWLDFRGSWGDGSPISVSNLFWPIFAKELRFKQLYSTKNTLYAPKNTLVAFSDIELCGIIIFLYFEAVFFKNWKTGHIFEDFFGGGSENPH